MLLHRINQWLEESQQDTIGDSLFRLSYLHLNQNFKRALASIIIDCVRLTLHILRHGRATNYWIKGQSVPDVTKKGRCKLEKTVEIYLSSQRALMVRTQITMKLHRRIR